MRRTRWILVFSAVFCALALVGAWLAVSAYAVRHTHELLGRSREHFVQTMENTLDDVLWYAGSLAVYALDESERPRSVPEMQRIADVLYLDELTLVGTNGVAIASNYAEYIGFDWHSTPQTAAYLMLVDPSAKAARLSEHFRPCVINHENYRKYAGVALTNRLGFVQVGYSMDRLVYVMSQTSAVAFNRWKFGRQGRFGAVDGDEDGVPDVADSTLVAELSDGKVDEVEHSDGIWHRLTFPFAGRLFYAEVPDREFGDSRNAAFFVAAVLIVLLFLAFTAILVRLRLSSLRLEKLRRDADRRAAADMQLAHTIQLSTLPQAAVFNPDCLAYDLEALMLPAREVGGDFYDFFALADGRLAFVIGDASGKGVPSAMFMLVAKNAVRQAVHSQGDPAIAMAAVNAALCADNAAGMFMTMVLAILDPTSGEVTYVNAGHNRPLVVRADGSVERLEVRGGRLLGLFPGLEYRSAGLRLKVCDRLLLYTDGVTEAMDARSRQYGEARLKALLAMRPTKICAAVHEDIAKHVDGAPASDDLTMLAIAWQGSPTREVRTFPADRTSIGAALEFLRAACPSGQNREIARLLQVADEVMTNVIDYSGSPDFALEVETGSDRFKFILVDTGREYNPLIHPEPDIHAPLENRPVGGLGILVAKNLSDYISWRRENGQNRLTVVKYMN